MLSLQKIFDSTMKKVLIINGRPNAEQSIANKFILEKVAKELPEAEILTLSREYPNGVFDIEREQKRLAEADIIVFEYPLYWYALPWLLQKYLEDTLTFGFAYGTDDIKLKGKKVISSFTCGSDDTQYQPGQSGETFADLPRPMQATCWLCGIEYAGTVITTGLEPPTLTPELSAKLTLHADKLVALINSL